MNKLRSCSDCLSASYASLPFTDPTRFFLLCSSNINSFANTFSTTKCELFLTHNYNARRSIEWKTNGGHGDVAL